MKRFILRVNPSMVGWWLKKIDLEKGDEIVANKNTYSSNQLAVSTNVCTIGMYQLGLSLQNKIYVLVNIPGSIEIKIYEQFNSDIIGIFSLSATV